MQPEGSPPTNSDIGYLWDMRHAAQETIEFTRNLTFEQFAADLALVCL